MSYWEILKRILQELGRSDQDEEPPHWYHKANTLFAHAMLGAIIGAPVSLLVHPISYTYLVIAILSLVFILKEVREFRGKKPEVFFDSIVDTLAPVFGAWIPVVVLQGDFWSALVISVGLLALWLVYPITWYKNHYGD